MADNPTILITRAEPQASRFAEELAQVSPVALDVRALPLARVRRIGGVLSADGVDAVAFTSENAVRAAQGAWVGPRVPAFAVGARTARVASDAGWPVESADGTAADLAALVGRNGGVSRVLWPCGKAAPRDLEDLLQMAGIEVVRRDIYEIIESEGCADLCACVRQSPRPILPVFSPASAVRVSLCLGGLLGKAAIVAISEAAAAPVSGAASLTVARTPDGPAMIAAILQVASS